MKYEIALRESEEGLSVAAPGLPGCWSQGATESEALENIQAAVREYLAVVAELFTPLPAATEVGSGRSPRKSAT